MKNKTIWMLILILLLTLTAVGCKKEDPPAEDPPVETIDAIVDLLQTASNNKNVIIEGIVYGRTTSGFYISDSELGKIYVTGSTLANIGDKVKVAGVYGITDSMPRIKNVTEIVVLASNQSLPVPEELTVEQVMGLSYTAKTGSYARYVNLVVTIEAGTVNTYLKSDLDNSLIFSTITDLTKLAEAQGKRVTIPVILHEYNSQDLTWRVSFAGASSDIVLTPISFATLVEEAMLHINSVVPTEIYGALVLPKNHPTMTYLTYTWSVASNNYIQISNGIVTVTTDSVDHSLDLTVMISDGEEEVSKTVNIVSKAIIQREVKDFVENKPTIDESAVILRGIVVAITRNQSLSLRSIIIKDKTSTETMSIDFAGTGENQILHTNSAFTSLKLGDEIVVRGLFRTTTRQTIYNVTSIDLISSDNPVSHDTTNAYVLDSQEAYEHLANNYDDYANKLVKFEDPFMNYSTSTPPTITNWVRLGYSETSANAKHDGKRNFALLIAANNESTGSEKWHKMFDIPLLQGPAAQFDGSFYAYAMYVSDTYIAFVVADASLWQYENQLSIEYDLGQDIPSSLEEGVISLRTSHPSITGEITWSSSNEAVISSTTGIVTGVDTNTVVSLTATYTYNEKVYTSTYEVTILGTEALSISSVLQDGIDESKVKVKGIFVAYQSDGNDNAARDGIILLDEVSGDLLLVNGMAQVGGIYGAYLDSFDNPLEFGHEVQIVGTYYKDSLAIGSGPDQVGRRYLEVSDDSIIKRLSEDKKTIDWKTTNAITIATNEELNDFALDLEYGKLIKLVGTAENPIYLGGSTSSDYEKINIKVFKTPATNNDGVKYNGQTFSLKNDINSKNASDTWLKDLFGIENAFVGPTASVPAKPYMGTIYVVVSARTGTYYQLSLVNYEETSISKIYSASEVNASLIEGLPMSIEAGEFNISLKTTHQAITGEVVWTSSDPEIIDLATNTVIQVSDDTELSLIGTYTLYGEINSVEYKIIVQASSELQAKQVSAIIASTTNESFVRVVGYVAGYQSDGNDNTARDGIILMDKTDGTLLLVNGLALVNEGTYGAYKDKDGKVLEIGNEVIITGTYYLDSLAIGSGPAQTGRKYLEVTKDSDIIKVGDDIHSLPWDKANAIVITSNADLVNFSENLEYGKLIKLVGTAENPIYLGGSSSSNYEKNNIKVFKTPATDNNGTKYNGQTFSLKNDVNMKNASDTWLKDLFGIENAFVGPTASVPAKPYMGTIYVVVSARTGTYYQLSLVNYSEATASLIP